MLAELEYATLISRLVVGAFLPDLLTFGYERVCRWAWTEAQGKEERRATPRWKDQAHAQGQERQYSGLRASQRGVFSGAQEPGDYVTPVRHCPRPPAGLGTLGLARCVWGPFFLSSPPFPAPVGVVACTIRAGIGREEPNANPHLPEPETRVNMMGALMMGPFAIIKELLGPGVRTPSPHVWLRLLAFVARIAFLNTARSRPFVRAALQEAPRPGLLLRLRCNHRDDDPASAGRRDDELPHRRRRRVIRAFGCR